MDGEDVGVGGAARVERTGIALVHEGELVVPAPDAAATLAPASAGPHDGPDDATEVHYWFPVQVEVVGLTGPAADDVVARVLDELATELGARG